MATPAVTVAIVSWNTRDLLDACLGSLRADHEAGRAEIWVVDNGSTDGSVEMVADRHPWVRVVERPDNPGFGAAVNDVAGRTTSDWIVAANADIAVGADALRGLLVAGARHPRVGVLAPRLVTPDGVTQHSIHPFPGVRTAIAVDLGLTAVIPGLGRRLALEGSVDPLAQRDVDWAHGALLMVRRATWEATGGFDPSMWMYAEDLDLCWRARRAGWTTRYVPSVTVVHHVSAATSQAWGEARSARAERAAHEWMHRTLGPRRAGLITALGRLGATVRVGALQGGTRVAPERYGWRLERARTLRDVRAAASRREGS